MKYFVFTPEGVVHECDSVQAVIALKVVEKLDLSSCKIVKGNELCI